MQGKAMMAEMSAEARTMVGELDTRVVKVETKLDNVIAAIGDLTKAVKDIASRPQAIAWREILVTTATILGLLHYVGAYLEGQYGKNISPEKARMERIEKALCLAKQEFCILVSK